MQKSVQTRDMLHEKGIPTATFYVLCNDLIDTQIQLFKDYHLVSKLWQCIKIPMIQLCSFSQDEKEWIKLNCKAKNLHHLWNIP